MKGIEMLEHCTPEEVIQAQDRVIEELRSENAALKATLPLVKPVNRTQKAGGIFRAAFSAEWFPYGQKTVPFIRIQRGGHVSIAQHPDEKLNLIFGMREGDLLLAVWPGKWASDVFIVDNLDSAKEELLSR